MGRVDKRQVPLIDRTRISVDIRARNTSHSQRHYPDSHQRHILGHTCLHDTQDQMMDRLEIHSNNQIPVGLNTIRQGTTLHW